MEEGNYVFVVKKEVMTGDKRPSLARILHIDEEGGKALVESTYKMMHSNLPDHMRWVVPLGACIPVSKSVLDVAAASRPSDCDVHENDLVCWVDKGDGMVNDGIVVKSTPKTVEILKSGAVSVIRKKKDLIIKL